MVRWQQWGQAHGSWVMHRRHGLWYPHAQLAPLQRAPGAACCRHLPVSSMPQPAVHLSCMPRPHHPPTHQPHTHRPHLSPGQVDWTPPDLPPGGAVYSGERFGNEPFQTETDSLAASWDEFVDEETGVEYYSYQASGINFHRGLAVLQESKAVCSVSMRHGAAHQRLAYFPRKNCPGLRAGVRCMLRAWCFKYNSPVWTHNSRGHTRSNIATAVQHRCLNSSTRVRARQATWAHR